MIYRLSLRFIASCGIFLALASFFLLLNSAASDRFLDNLPSFHPSLTSNHTNLVEDETKNCDRCLTSPEWCAEFGSRNLGLSVAYEGTGERLRRVLAKSERGEPIKFGNIGGSLSRGHGCHCIMFHRQIFDWWNETFPHPDNLYVDGSVGARGSSYFKFCHAEHLRPDLDLVVVELSINDRLEFKDVQNIESILRSILSYPSQPAVIMTASFSLMDKIQTGNDAHIPVAQYYDVPESYPPPPAAIILDVINMRNSLLPIIFQNPDMMKTYFAWEHPDPDRVDVLHFSKLGHTALAKTTIALIQRQACILKRGQPYMSPDPSVFPPGEDYSTSVPRQRMTDFFKSSLDVHSPIDRPTCKSIDSERNPLVAAPEPLDKGWEPWVLPKTTKRYMRATEPGARVSFSVDLTSGQVMLYYLRSKSMGLGHAKCWFDDDVKAAKELDGWWDRTTNVGDYTSINDKPIPAGKHMLRCEVLPKKGTQEGRGTTFLIIAVMTI